MEIWLSINPNEMMRESMKDFLAFLDKNDVKYISYSVTGNKLYMHLKNVSEDTDKELAQWSYYNPIQQLKKKPKISIYDIIEDMSIDPYGE